MPAPKPKPVTLGESALLARLMERHPMPEWAFFSHVRDAAGFNANRTLDALAMNTWPSRGLEVHGFECKSSRGDWLREKEDPSKAEAFARFCDRWWLVVGDEEIVRAGELPPTWGLLVPRGTGLVAKVEAPKLNPIPFGRSQVAVLLRRATEPGEAPPEEAELARKLDAAYQSGVLAGQKKAQADLSEARREADRHRQAIAAFQEASGVQLQHWQAGNIGKAVAVVLGGGLATEERRLRQARDTAARVVADLDEQLGPEKDETEEA